MPGWSLGVPGHLPGASRELVRTFFCDATKIDEAFEGSRARRGAHFGSQPGQAGTPNLLKTCTCDQKGGVGERL